LALPALRVVVANSMSAAAIRGRSEAMSFQNGTIYVQGNGLHAVG
jgi:hypothetical protein